MSHHEHRPDASVKRASVAGLAKIAKSYEATPSLTGDFIHSFLSSLDCPRSLTVWLLWDSKEFQQLVDLDIDPHTYADPLQFRDAYTATLLLAKADFIPLSVSKRDAAIAKFSKFEDQCKQTNRRFRNLSLDPSYTGSNVWLLNATIRKIELILGDFCPEEWVDSCNWGPGSSTLLKGAHVSGANKFDTGNGITSALYSLVHSWFGVAYPLWAQSKTLETGELDMRLQRGNKIVTVPKNSKADRVIAMEPDINLWFQKGIGMMIRRRLLRWGIDLNDQSRNQNLAALGSVTPEWSDRSLATIDFSSASDSIARSVVENLFTGTWLQVLDATRSPLGTLDGNLVQWQKFSSMGNGYTFELQSLIFFAAALSVQELEGTAGEISVYGDDVILPTACVNTFQSFCAFLGFTINHEKSFFSSSFRESCGSHYFDGVDTKPLYLKGKVTHIQSVYKLANGVRLLAHRRNTYYGCDARFRRCYSDLLRRVPKSLRLKVPAGFGECGFASNFDEAAPSRAKHGIEGFRVVALVDVGITQQCDTPGMNLYRLKALSASRLSFSPERVLPRYLKDFRIYLSSYSELPEDQLWSDGGYSLRAKTRRKICNLLVHQYNLGPWI